MEFGATLILKTPFASALTPVLAPLIFTLAAGTGFPVASVILPVTSLFCENDSNEQNTSTVKSGRNFLMCSEFWFYEQ